MRLILSHPHGAQVARATAEALQGHGLSCFVTGFAVRASRAQMLGGPKLRRLQNRVVPDDLLLKSLWAVEFGARLGAAVAGRILRGADHTYDWVFRAHDTVASMLPWGDADTVYAYEDAALRTFQRAASRGMRRIYDLPTPHYASVQAMHQREAKRWTAYAIARVEPESKRRRKDLELALADEVMVASAHTRDSLLRTGYKGPVHVVPYGFPVEQFAAREAAPAGPFTVLAVGAQSVRKGSVYLLEAWRAAALREAQLVLIGRLDIPDELMHRAGPSVIHIPYLARADLAAWYARADVLAFPTLADGFGLVIQEAMCVGVPVITTRCGGGPECITDGVDGWIIDDASVEALVDALRFASTHRDVAAATGRQARARSERYTWEQAANRLRAVLGVS